MHEWLKEIYNDFCQKYDMPKHNGAYLSADDYLHGDYQLSEPLIGWLKNYDRLWVETNAMEDWN